MLQLIQDKKENKWAFVLGGLRIESELGSLLVLIETFQRLQQASARPPLEVVTIFQRHKIYLNVTDIRQEDEDTESYEIRGIVTQTSRFTPDIKRFATIKIVGCRPNGIAEVIHRKHK